MKLAVGIAWAVSAAAIIAGFMLRKEARDTWTYVLMAAFPIFIMVSVFVVKRRQRDRRRA